MMRSHSLDPQNVEREVLNADALHASSLRQAARGDHFSSSQQIFSLPLGPHPAATILNLGVLFAPQIQMPATLVVARHKSCRA